MSKASDMSALKVTLNDESNQTVRFGFVGQSQNKDFKNLSDFVATELRRRRGLLRRVVFDLSRVDGVLNTAGRIFDLAKFYAEATAADKVRMEMHIPQDIYADLCEIDSPNLPSSPDPTSPAQGVYFRIGAPTATAIVESPAPVGPKILLSCLGRIRRVENDHIFVSLFVDPKHPDVELAGEMDVAQFPDVTLSPGAQFRYQAIVQERGVTVVKIDLKAALELTEDEKFDAWAQVKDQVPMEEF